MSITESDMNKLNQCIDPDSGYLHFILNYFYFEDIEHGHTPFVPRSYQLKMLKTYHKNNHILSLNARQNGSSLCGAAYLLWYAMFKPNQSIFITAPNLSMIKDLISKIKYGYTHCPDIIKSKVTIDTPLSLGFENGSLISTLSNCNVVPGLIFADSFAFDSNSEELANNIFPQAEKVIISSSANTNKDTFYKLWKMSEFNQNDYVRFKSTWGDNPNLTREWQQETIDAIGPERFNREYNCIFPISIDQEEQKEIINHLNAVGSYLESGGMRKMVVETEYDFDLEEFNSYLKINTKSGTVRLPLDSGYTTMPNLSVDDVNKIIKCNITLLKNNQDCLSREEQEFLIDPIAYKNARSSEELDRLRAMTITLTRPQIKEYMPPLQEVGTYETAK